jgi:hypothetical protein
MAATPEKPGLDRNAKLTNDLSYDRSFDMALGEIVMAGLDPAIPLINAQPCHVIGIAGSSPAMTGEGEPNSPAVASRRPNPQMKVTP